MSPRPKSPIPPVKPDASSNAPAPLPPRSLNKDRTVIVRDLIIFQIKLFLDGVKDIVLSPLSIIAAGLDILSPTKQRGRRLYAVLTLGERFDRWLNLFNVSERAAQHEEGLFGASRAGADTLLGKLEELVIGHAEDEDPEGEDPEVESDGEADRSGRPPA